MPDGPQGTVRFKGIDPDFITGGTYTKNHGFAPSVISLECVLPDNFDLTTLGTGDVTFRYGNVVINVPDCIVDTITPMESNERGQGGFKPYVINILDGRWRWRFGVPLDGFFNIDQRKEVTAFDLVVTAVDSMTSQLGGKLEIDKALHGVLKSLYIEMKWYTTDPAKWLEQFLSSIGATIGLNHLQGFIPTIFPIGKGQPLINLNLAPPPDVTLVSRQRVVGPQPDKLALKIAPNRYESVFILEAVGLDLDQEIKRINDLSYKPAKGWDSQIPGVFAGVAGGLPGYVNPDPSQPTAHSLAMLTVFRWYRIRMLEDPGTVLAFPDLVELGADAQKQIEVIGPDGKVVQSINLLDDIRTFLPLESGRVTQKETPNADDPFNPTKTPLPPELWGVYNDRFIDAVDVNTTKTTSYTGGFDIDNENGIIITDGYLFKVIDGKYKPADMKLFIGHPLNVKIDKVGGIPATPFHNLLIHQRRNTKMLGIAAAINNTELYHIVSRTDLALEHYVIYNRELEGVSFKFTNMNEIIDTTKEQLTQISDSFNQSENDSHTISRAGLVPNIPSNGAIKQVTWHVGAPHASTTASYEWRHQPSYTSIRRSLGVK
jgi:hypothetical protein